MSPKAWKKMLAELLYRRHTRQKKLEKFLATHEWEKTSEQRCVIIVKGRSVGITTRPPLPEYRLVFRCKNCGTEALAKNESATYPEQFIFERISCRDATIKGIVT